MLYILDRLLVGLIKCILRFWEVENLFVFFIFYITFNSYLILVGKKVFCLLYFVVLNIDIIR